MMKGNAILNYAKKQAIVVVLLFEIIILSILTPNFLTFSNLMTVIRQISYIGIAGVGMTIVLLAGGFDLSIGMQAAFVNVAAAYMMKFMGIHPVIACLICMVFAILFGYLNGICITTFRIPPLIATLATQYVLKGLANIVSQGQAIFAFNNDFKIIGQGYVFQFIPIPIIILVLMLILGWFILSKTYLGRYFFAIGGNETAAKLSGIKTDRMKRLSYVLCALFTAIAALIMLSRLNSGTAMTGEGLEFNAIAAAVLGGVSISGGRAKIFNMFIGVLIIGILTNGFVLLNIGEYPQLIVKGLVLLVAVGFDMSQTKKQQ